MGHSVQVHCDWAIQAEGHSDHIPSKARARSTVISLNRLSVGCGTTPRRQLRDLIDFPFGEHVNVLSDYKETVPENYYKCLHSHCSHVTDMLIECLQNYISQALLKCMHVHCP